MMSRKILLVCGAGMSSGILAQKTRKIAKKQGLNYSVKATSQNELPQYISSIDMVLVGPHFTNQFDKIKALAKNNNVSAELIPDDVYGMLDGESLVKIIKKSLEGE